MNPREKERKEGGRERDGEKQGKGGIQNEIPGWCG